MMGNCRAFGRGKVGDRGAPVVIKLTPIGAMLGFVSPRAPVWIKRSPVGLAAGGLFFEFGRCPWRGSLELAGCRAGAGKEVMQDSQIDRRATLPTVELDKAHADSALVVRQGMLVQTTMGTLSAVEFLKQHGVQGAVIQRVLTSEQVRVEDQQVLGQTAR